MKEIKRVFSTGFSVCLVFWQHHVCTQLQWIPEKSSLLFHNHNFWNFIERILNITCLGIIIDLYRIRFPLSQFPLAHLNMELTDNSLTNLLFKIYPIKPHIFPQQFDVPVWFLLSIVYYNLSGKYLLSFRWFDLW